MNSKPSILRSSILQLAASAALVASFPSAARAAALTWSSGSGTWQTGVTGWGTGGTTAWNNATPDTATFGGADGTYAITIGGPITLGNAALVFNFSGYTLSAATARTITMNTGAAGGTVTVATGKSATVGSNVTLSRVGTINFNGGGTLNVTGTGATVSGSGNFTVNAATTLNIGTGGLVTTTNSYVIGDSASGGSVTINGGSLTSTGTGAFNLVLGNSGTAGTTGTVTLSSGSISMASTTAGTGLRFGVGAANANATSGTFNLDGGTLTVLSVYETAANTGVVSTFNFNGGTLKALLDNATFMTGLDSAIVKNGGAVIDTNSKNITIGQALVAGSGSTGGLTKNSAGTLTLTGNNTYTGTTLVTGGTLSLGRSGGTLLDASAVTVNGGTLDVANSDTVGAITLTSGTISGSGTLTGSSYSLLSGTVTAPLGGGAAVNKTTSGVVNLGGTQTYTTATNASAGTLNITGSLGNTLLTVAGSATLGGEGSSTGGVVFNAGSKFVFDANTTGAGQYFRTTGNINTTAGASSKIIIDLAAATTNTGVVIFEGGSISTNGLSDFKLNTRGTLTLTSTQLLFDYGSGTVEWKGGNTTSPTFWDVNTTAQNFTLAGVDDFFLGGDNVNFTDSALNFSPVVQTALVAGTVTFDNSLANPYTLSGQAVTATSLLKTGTGKLTISNALTASSGVTVSNGTLQLGDGTNATGSITGGITNNAALILDYGGNSVTVGNAISGSGSLTQAGSGVVTLTGANSYGTTTISAGTLQLGSGASGGTTGTLGAGSVTNNGALVFNRSDNVTVGNAISGTGSLTKQGGTTAAPSSLTLTSGNSYDGSTTIANGALIVTANNALGSTVAGTTVASSGALGLSGGINYTATETITGSGLGLTATIPGVIGAVQRGFVQSVSGSNSFAGNIVLNANGLSRIGTQDGASLTLTGSITQASGITTATLLFRAGGVDGDFVTLSGAGNSWGTDASIFSSLATGSAGVRLGVNNGLPSGLSISGASSSGAGTALDLAGFDQMLNGLVSGAGLLKIINSNAGDVSILTLNPSSARTSGNTTISNSGGGDIALVKDGAFTQTLAGAHTYTGSTTINAGTLAVTGSLASAVTVNSPGALGGEGLTTGNLTFGAGSIFVFDPTTTGTNQFFRAGVIDTTAGAGTKININLTTPVTSGTGIVVLQGSSFTTNGLSDFKLNARGTLSLTSTQLLFDYGTGSVVWKGANATNPGFWDVNTTTQNFTLAGADDFFLTSDNVLFDDTAASYSPSVQTALTAGTLTFSNATDYTLGGAAVAASSLTKTGTGKTTISNALTLASGTTISGGALQLGNGGATGSVSGPIVNNAALVTDFGATDVTLASAISGTGTLTKEGTGKATLTGAQTFTGATTINGGTLAFSNTGITTAGANLDTTIGGAGSLEKLGAGLLTVDTANTYAGTTTITTGALVLDGAGALGSTAAGTTVASGASLGLSGGAGIPSGESLAIAGTGITSAAYFNATSNVQRGALQTVSGSSTVSSPILVTATNTRIGVQDGAQLALTGSITESAPGTTVIFRHGNTAGSDITISGTGNSWTGTTDIFGGGGAVKLGADNVLPTGTLLRVGTTGIAGNSALDLNGYQQAVAGLSQVGGAAAIITNNGAGPSTLSLNAASGTQTFTGIIQDGSQPVSLTKAGAYTQSLTGANTWSGTTSLTGGTLLLGASNTLPSGAGFLVGGTGGKLDAGGTANSTGALTLSTGSTMVVDFATGNGQITFSGTGTWNGTLAVWNYTGTIWTPGTDKLNFTTSGLTAADLQDVHFFTGPGTGQIDVGGAGFIGTELVPIPEPATFLGGVLLLGVIAHRETRRTRRTQRLPQVP